MVAAQVGRSIKDARLTSYYSLINPTAISHSLTDVFDTRLLSIALLLAQTGPFQKQIIVMYKY